MSRMLPDKHVFDVGVDDEHDEEQSADGGHGEQKLEDRLGDELNGHQRPVRRGDERAAFQRGFEGRDWVTTDLFSVTVAVSS